MATISRTLTWPAASCLFSTADQWMDDVLTRACPELFRSDRSAATADR